MKGLSTRGESGRLIRDRPLARQTLGKSQRDQHRHGVL